MFLIHCGIGVADGADWYCITRITHVVIKENTVSAIITIKNIASTGIVSEFRGRESLTNSRNTARASNIVIVKEILSPLSGGKKKPNKIVITNNKHGKIILNR